MSASAGRAAAMNFSTTLQTGDALVVVDLQNDRLPGGASPVEGMEEIVEVMGEYAAKFERAGLPVYATRYWHPEDHRSFAPQGGAWPAHCVRHTAGAEFPPSLVLPPGAVTISKGTDPGVEAHSAFSHPDFEAWLREGRVRRLFVGGVTLEHGVLQTVLDARQRGFEVFWLRDAVRAAGRGSEDERAAVDDLGRCGATPIALGELCHPNPCASAMLTDVGEFTMLGAYLEAGMEGEAVFEFFIRRLPAGWNFLVAVGLEQVVDFLDEMRFDEEELEWLARERRYKPELIRHLREMRFMGDVHAMPEGTIFFPLEPILQITAPIAQAQMVGAKVVNLLQFQTMVASKAARAVVAAGGRTLVDLGLRRTHGAEAGMLSARACHLVGFDATSDALAAQRYGIPTWGTLAHAFVEAAETEEEAFMRFACASPDPVVLHLDSFDTEEAARLVVRIAPKLRAQGVKLAGVQIDRGDLAARACQVRALLDAGGLCGLKIFLGGNLDEYELARIVMAGVPVDGFGLGSRTATSTEDPFLDCTYQLRTYAGRPRGKRSEARASWPGVKQVFRQGDAIGRMECDIVALADEAHAGEPLLRGVMHGGHRLGAVPSLAEMRGHFRRQLEALPPGLRRLEAGQGYGVYMSEAVHDLGVDLGVFAAMPHPEASVEAPLPV